MVHEFRQLPSIALTLLALCRQIIGSERYRYAINCVTQSIRDSSTGMWSSWVWRIRMDEIREPNSRDQTLLRE